MAQATIRTISKTGVRLPSKVIADDSFEGVRASYHRDSAAGATRLRVVGATKEVAFHLDERESVKLLGFLAAVHGYIITKKETDR